MEYLKLLPFSFQNNLTMGIIKVHSGRDQFLWKAMQVYTNITFMITSQ